MITQIGQPVSVHMPGYNPVVWYFDSNRKELPGFKYIVQVIDEDDNVMFEKSILPDFESGKCVLQIDKELSDYLSYDLNPTNLNTLPVAATKSYKRYKLSVGEEYFYEFRFNFYLPFLNDGVQDSTLFINNDIGSIPDFEIGDFVNVRFNATPTHPELIGDFEILNIASGGGTTAFRLDVTFDPPSTGGTPIYESGTISTLTREKTRVPGLLTTDLQSVFNGTLNTAEWLSYNQGTYFFNGASILPKFLSQLPTTYKVRRSNSIFLNFMKNHLDTSITGPNYLKVTNLDTSGTSNIYFTTDYQKWVYQFNVGPTRSVWGTPTSGLINSSTTSYKMQMYNKNDTAISAAYTILIDDSCAEENMEMLFLDKLGSFLPYNFTLKNVESQEVNRTSYTQHLGGKVGSKFTYDLINGGDTIYDSNYTRKWLLRTGFLNNDEAIFFQNVLHSPITVLKIDGIFQRVSITTNNIEIKKGKWSTLKRYELNVTLANQDKINI